ncbi:MAG: efflux RND transporter periplasmic adaptor subunit [Spirochaetes bacterium]|nr:efflux RND transporter periplasmic adaptor subunit [Spirochaetota bacterium]
MKTKAIIIILFSLSVLACSRGTDKEKDKKINVKVMKVKKEIIEESLYSIGTVSYTEKANITSKVMGKVERVFVDVGSSVSRGTALLQLEKFELQLELKKALAELESARSTLQLVEEKYKNATKRVEQQLNVVEKAKADLEDKEVSLENVKRITERKKQLLDIGAITKQEYENLQTELTTYETKFKLAKKELEIQLNGYRDEDIIQNGYQIPRDQKEKIKILKEINTTVDKAEVDVQRAKVKNAQAQVDSIRLLLQNSTIRSPLNGIVAIRDIEPGERIAGEQPLLVIMNIDHVYALLNIPESQINDIKKQNKVELKVDALGEKIFKGHVNLISPIVDLKTRTIEIKAKFKNADHILKPGMFARAHIFTGKKTESITIPSSCVVSSKENTAEIFVLHNKNEVYTRKIEFTETTGNRLDVTKGLNENDLVILDNIEKLNEGDKVDVQF